jgi:hypothetical protein
LGGRLVLPEASCRSCEQITSQVELDWLRSTFYAARVQKGFGKKKKRVPRTLPLEVTIKGKSIIKAIPIEKYPALVVTLLFDTPEVLLDIKPVEKLLTGGVAAGILPTFGDLMKEYLAQGSVTFKPPRSSATSTQLGRLLAKIAHAYAVAELGLDGFSPVLLPIILGSDVKYLAHYVGGSREIPQRLPVHYSLNLSSVRSLGGTTFLLVSVRIFSDIQGIPMYKVVVGTPRSNTQQGV